MIFWIKLIKRYIFATEAHGSTRKHTEAHGSTRNYTEKSLFMHFSSVCFRGYKIKFIPLHITFSNNCLTKSVCLPGRLSVKCDSTPAGLGIE